MVIELDVETGNVLKVTDGKAEVVGKPIKELTLLDNDKRPHNFISFPDYTIIRTKASPGCIWLIHNGQWYRVCN